MSNFDDLSLTEEQLRAGLARQKDAHEKQKGKPRPRARKPLAFFRFSPSTMRKLIEIVGRGNSKILAAICALSEAWYRTGYHGEHDNPFPLSTVDAQSWGLRRQDLHRVLKILGHAGLIEVNRSNVKSPSVLINWERPS